MHRTLAALTLTSLALASPRAEAGMAGGERKFGLGFMLGEPTAVTAKFYFADPKNAIDTAIATDFDYGGFYGHVVYLWHHSVLATESDFDLGWHVGVGGAIADGWYGWHWGNHGHYYSYYDDFALAARIPIGLDMDLNKAPLQIFGNLALNLWVTAGMEADLGAAFGLRYYF